MKETRVKRIAVLVIVFFYLTLAMRGSESSQESGLDIRQPPLDTNGRFWVYKDGKSFNKDKKLGLKPIPPYGIPYCPYAWMPEAASRMIKMDLENKIDPNEGNMCIRVSIEWKDPYWCGIGFVSGPDKGKSYAPWWGKTPHGWYYDLSKLKRKKFVVYMRGEKGGEKVQWKVGFLAHEKYGDSLHDPVETKWLKLDKEWKRFEIDLKKKDLSRICSICFVVAQHNQDDENDPIIFYVDQVYFE